MWGYWLLTSRTTIEKISGIIRRRNEHGACGSEGTKKGVGPLDFLAEGPNSPTKHSSCCPLCYARALRFR